MSGDVHVRFYESVGVKPPGATHLVILCRSQEEAAAVLEGVRQWTELAGLVLHPVKTRIVDATQRGGFDFLGYHFERERKWPRKKSLGKFKDTIRAKTRRTQGRSLTVILSDVNRSLRGWFEYFKHSYPTTFRPLDAWVRMRLRSILRQRRGGKACGRGSDHQRWPNAFFVKHGLNPLCNLYAWEWNLRQSRTG